MITIVAERWDPERGGRERYAADLVEFLAAEGRRVVKAHARNVDGTRASQVLALAPTRVATHYQLHGGLLARAFAAEREAMQSRVRRALFGPGLRLNRHRRHLLAAEALLLTGGTQLMTFSDTVARELVEDRGVAASRVIVSRPGVDLRRFSPSPAGGGEPPATGALRLVFVGHNFALKGLHTTILALARARHMGISASVTVAGRGASGPYARLAAMTGVTSHVRFLGAVSQARMADLYRASDALIHPTFYDPFPRVVIEALACACPVITTARCGAAEILTERQSILVHDPRDVTAFADAIGTLADGRTRHRMGAAAGALGCEFDAGAHFRTTLQWLDGPVASEIKAGTRLIGEVAP